jgi:NET1-associated nuclear protein 1 (U3 small nucleolar RNA-associated protein 17)
LFLWDVPVEMSAVEYLTNWLNSPQILDKSTWAVTSTVGGKFPQIRPLFSKDKKHFFVLASVELRVYFLATQQCVRSFPIEDVVDVTDLYLDEHDESKLWIIRSTGKCEVLNWQDKLAERSSVNLDTVVHRMVSIPSESRFILLVEDNGLKLIEKIRNLENGQLEEEEASERQQSEWTTNVISYCKNGKLFAISNSKRYFAFYSTQKKGDIVSAGEIDDDFKVVKEKDVKRSRAIMAMDVSNDGVIAVGSVTGVVDLYYDFFSENGPSIRALKWHVDSVLSLSFALGGDYLLSGGREKVLVFWQLETEKTQFLPRLEGEIASIVVDPTSELYALSLQGEQILVLSAVDLVSRLQVSGIKAVFNKIPNLRKRRIKHWDTKKVGDYTTSYYINPQTKHGYFPAKDRSLVQVYDTIKDTQLAVFSTASTIQTGKVGKETLIEDPQVTHICFTADGKWMATVDERSTPKIDRLLSKDDKEINLKFWSLNDKTNKWQLATRVSAPHGLNKIILDIIPTTDNEHGFITAAQDGGLRLWRPSNDHQEIASTTRTVSWGVRKLVPPSGITSSAVAVCSSNDSSVVILGVESTLYLVDGAKFEIIKTLPNILGSRVRALGIVGTKLVALSKTRLVVWDLLLDQQLWSVQVLSTVNGGKLFAVDPVNGRFALALNYITKDQLVESYVLIFRPEAPLPLAAQHHPFGTSSLKHIPGTANFSFVNIMGQINTLLHAPRGALKAGIAVPVQEDETVNIASLFKAKKVVAVRQEENVVMVDEGQDTVLNIHSFDKVFDGTEYNMSSLETLFDKVFGVISPKVTR